MLANRKLKQRRRRQLQKRCLILHRTYSISFNSSNVGKFFWSCILKDCIEVQGNKQKVVRHSLSRCSHAATAKKCTKERDARAKLFFYFSKFLAFLPFSLPSPSSLLKLPIASVLKGLSVLERRTSTGSEAFSLFTCLDDIQFVLLYSYRDDLTENLGETTAQECKSPLPVDVHRSKTPLLKAPNVFIEFIPPPSGSVHVYHWSCGARRESRTPFQLFVVQTEDREFS